MISYPFTAKAVTDVNGDIVYDDDGFVTYDRTITSAMERAFNKSRYTNGVFSYPADGLKLTPNSGMTVDLSIGMCNIEGAMGYNPTVVTYTLSDANASLPRIDRFVARFDLDDAIRGIEIYKKEGTVSTTPVAPTVTTEGNYYELVLADVYVGAGVTEITSSNITDQRLNSNLCGIVAAALPGEIDTTSIFDQYQDALDTWLSTVDAAINETLAGQLQTDIDANTASASAALAQSDVALAAANGAQSDVDDLETTVSNLTLTPSFASPTSVATALDSASGWTATGDGMLAIGGRATTTAKGYYFVTDKTIGGNVLLISMEESSYNSASIPIISGHVYSRTIGALTTEDKISNFYAFN